MYQFGNRVNFVSDTNKFMDQLTTKVGESIFEMQHIPRIGDTIPLFYNPYPKVKDVIWFPEKVDKMLAGIDVVIMID